MHMSQTSEREAAIYQLMATHRVPNDTLKASTENVSTLVRGAASENTKMMMLRTMRKAAMLDEGPDQDVQKIVELDVLVVELLENVSVHVKCRALPDLQRVGVVCTRIPMLAEGYSADEQFLNGSPHQILCEVITRSAQHTSSRRKQRSKSVSENHS